MAWPLPEFLAWIARIESRAEHATLFELLGIGSNADSATVQAAFHRIGAGAHPDLHRGALKPQEAERLVGAYGKVAAAYETLRDPTSRDRYRKEMADRGKAVSKPPVIGGSKSTRPPRTSGPTPGRMGSGPIAVAPPRATSPSLGRAQSPTTGSGAVRGSDRTPAPSPATTRTPLVTPPRAGGPSPAPAPPPSQPRVSTIPISGVPPGDSRPPTAGIAPRATVYFRKAQACLTRGDLGGALFNLRLASAADPTSATLRVALAEVEAEIAGKK